MTDNAVPPSLSVRGLTVAYGPARRLDKIPPVVRDVSFDVHAGETVGLVGESGSGKSTILKAILGLARVTSGSVELGGRDITHLTPKRRRGLVSDLRAVFQDPYGSLSPFQTVGDTIAEPLRLCGLGRAQIVESATDALRKVGLTANDLERYPHQFSGGQRQRIGIARALVSNPKVILMDEPVSALDLSVQAQVLNLLADLRDTGRFAVLFVGHDLGVVRFLCSHVVVLYRGRVVESGPAERITRNPKQGYTRALVDSSPVPHPAEQARRRNIRLRLQGRQHVGHASIGHEGD